MSSGTLYHALRRPAGSRTRDQAYQCELTSLVATHHARAPLGAPDDLLLKVTPPRVPRHQVARPRLRVRPTSSCATIPSSWCRRSAGFGKTSLLAQWRREHSARGSVVAWLSAQPRMTCAALRAEPRRWRCAAGAGRPTFGHTADRVGRAPAASEGVTAWLAEVAQTALDIVLIVDEADRAARRDARGAGLPVAQRAVQPARRGRRARRLPHRHRRSRGLRQLHVVGRGAACASGSTRRIAAGARALRHARRSRRRSARLHELTEGWPLGCSSRCR